MKQLLVILLITSANLAAISQQKSMQPEQQKLDYFIGRWTVEGSEATYLEVCNRIQGNHIQCVSASKEKTGVDSSTSYLSYSPLEKVYVYYGIYPSGNTRMLKGIWQTDFFVFEGERVTLEKTTRWRVTIRPIDRSLHFIEEVSVNHGPWEKKADFFYRRVK